MPKVHELKTWGKYYDEVKSGKKTFEIRLNDRKFSVGDHLNLIEFNMFVWKKTGRYLTVEVTHIMPLSELNNFQQIEYTESLENFVVMSIKKVENHG